MRRLTFFIFPMLALLSLPIAGCKKEIPAGKSGDLPAVKPMPPEMPKPKLFKITPDLSENDRRFREMMNARYDQSRIDWEIERDDRRELVWPAPEGFKPKVQGRKLEMRLIPKSKMLSKGKSFWYRIEIQNLGTERVVFWGGFLKDGWLDRTEFQFYITSPDGDTEEIWIGNKIRFFNRGIASLKEAHFSSEDLKNLQNLEDFTCGQDDDETDAYSASILKTPDWSHLSEKERDIAFRDWWYREGKKGTLRVNLLPGETVTSRPWRYVPCAEARERKKRGLPETPKIEGPFRELKTPYPFEKPGTYKIKVVYSGPQAEKPDEDWVQSRIEGGQTRAEAMESFRETNSLRLGIIESNTVTIERLP